MAEKISDKLVRELEAPPAGNRIIYDTEIRGFGVRVTAGGAKSFILNYRFHDASDIRRLSSEYRYTIGAYGPHDWSVAAARKEAGEWRKKVDRGEAHPLGERRGRREAVKANREAETFKEAVEDYITREQEGRRRNATAGEIKRAILKACAEWYKLPVASIEAKDVRALLEEIRDGDAEKKSAPRPYLANRLYAYLRTFFAWCAEPGIDKRPRSPMEGLRRPWDGEESRERVYSDDEIKALWKAADALGGAGGAFLKVLMLTGKRKSALAAMRWDEVDDKGVWTPPVDPRRRKRVKREHVTPLPKLAVRVLRGLKAKDGNPYVFTGRRKGSNLYPGTALQADIKEQSGIEDFRFHAIRHTLETRLAELRIAPHIRDLLLDHAPARGAGAGYDHHHYGEEMGEALETWAAHVERLIAPKGAKALR